MPDIRSTQRWVRTRAKVIRDQPWCTLCHHKGSTTNPLTADHITPLVRGGDPFDPANLQTLCRSCNARKGQTEKPKAKRFFGDAQKQEAALFVSLPAPRTSRVW